MKKYSLVEVLIVAIAVLGFILVLPASFNANEVFECNKWNREATQFLGYYVTNWQVEQCAAHNIALTAPVK